MSEHRRPKSMLFLCYQRKGYNLSLLGMGGFSQDQLGRWRIRIGMELTVVKKLSSRFQQLVEGPKSPDDLHWLHLPIKAPAVVESDKCIRRAVITEKRGKLVAILTTASRFRVEDLT